MLGKLAQTADLPAPPIMTQPDYQLACSLCGALFEDDGFLLACPHAHPPALLATRYSCRTLECDPDALGIYRYRRWLPIANRLVHFARPVTYQSEPLSSILGLPNLWITFSGYWPEKGASLRTGTFKELEAYGVLSRIRQPNPQVLVVASAGNTAAAFARICSENGIRCLTILPASGMRAMRFPFPIASCVKTISLTENADYSDAIHLAEAISGRDGFVSAGGVRNVGRRDAVGTAMLSAVETIGALPDYYFQAVGSAAGAIAAHEAAKRLVRDSRFGRTLPRLMLSQNLPFVPIVDSWRRGRREWIEIERNRARTLTSRIMASVLSNQQPPYAVAGGIFDVLTESRGEMLAVTNEDARQAMRLFQECEGIDVDPAAGVALASLIQAANSKRIAPGACVLLHITGGGLWKLARAENRIAALPDLEIPLKNLHAEETVALACDLF